MLTKLYSFISGLKDFWQFINDIPTAYLKKLPIHSLFFIFGLTLIFNLYPFILHGTDTVIVAGVFVIIWIIASPFRFSWKYYNNTIDFSEPHELTIKCDKITHYTFELNIGRKKLQEIEESGNYEIQIKKPTFIKIQPKDLLPEQTWNPGNSKCSLSCNYNMERNNLLFVFKVSTSISAPTTNNLMTIHFILNETPELLHKEPLKIEASDCVTS